MLKKTVKYVDYDGNEREEDLYFNLSKAELVEMELSTAGGIQNYMRKIISAQDYPTLVTIFKDLILKAYGQKSLDGKRFIKNDDLRDEFVQTEAYSNLYMELIFDAKAAAAFVNGIIPSDLAEEVAKMQAANEASNS